MNCTRCGSAVEQGKSFCSTCGNQINTTVVPNVLNHEPTVVPTVVPQNESTVVPTVQKNNNSTVIAIVVVMVLFIGAGVAGVLFLKSTKASGGNTYDDGQHISLYEDTTTVIKKTTSINTTKANEWNTTQRMDKIDTVSTYKLNGLSIVIPEGFIPSYENNILTVYNEKDNKYYLVNVVIQNINNVDLDAYQQYLRDSGYEVNNFVQDNVGYNLAYRFDVKSNVGNMQTFLVQATSNRIVMFMFVNETDRDYMNNIMLASLGK